MAESNTQTTPANTEPQTPPANTPQATPIDYEKLASIINGKQAATEDSVLKGYFKQQGLSQAELTQAITSFKEQKAKNTPDVIALQSQLQQAQKGALQAQVTQQATIEAIKLGIPVDTVPYLLKLADFATAQDENGKLNEENIKKAINKVIEDIPALKPNAFNDNNKGFRIGSTGNSNQNDDDRLRAIFGIKK